MSRDVKFCLGLSLVIITVMGMLGLVIDGARALIYGFSDNWREIFVFTLSMTVIGVVIVIMNVLQFIWNRRKFH
jgi:hypothetical protein